MATPKLQHELKKKQPFDEFLSYEQGAMLENPSSSEEEQVENRVQYLMQECERMMKWIRDVAPCNCSKLYIEDILKEKKKFPAEARKRMGLE